MRSKQFFSGEQTLLCWDIPGALMAGVDEAGRGPLMGPVVAAAVILMTETRLLAWLTRKN
jgi:ribonuclease HII